MKARIRLIIRILSGIVLVLWDLWAFHDNPTRLAIMLVAVLASFCYSVTNSPENFKRFFWVNTISAVVLVAVAGAILISVFFY